MRFAASPQVASFLHSKLDFGDTAQAGQKANAEQRITATQADAAVEGANIKGDAMIEMAKMGADATRAQGDAAKQAGIFGGIGSAISGIGGGLIGGMNSNGQTGIASNWSGLQADSGWTAAQSKHLSTPGNFAETVIGPSGIGPTRLY